MSLIDDQIDSFIDGDEFKDCYDMSKYCPICGNLMKTRTGMYGKFRGCSSYPKCDYTESYEEYGQIIDM